jgi:hypothetical protein
MQQCVAALSCPGRSAARSGALQTRDRYGPWRSRISGTPLHFVTRCTASGTHDCVGRVRSLIHFSNSPDLLVPAAHFCVRVLPLISLTPNRRVGGAPKGASCIVVAPVRARVSRVCETRRASCEACMTRSPLGAPPWRLSPRPQLRLRIISGNALNERGFCLSSIDALRSQEA